MDDSRARELAEESLVTQKVVFEAMERRELTDTGNVIAGYVNAISAALTSIAFSLAAMSSRSGDRDVEIGGTDD